MRHVSRDISKTTKVAAIEFRLAFTIHAITLNVLLLNCNSSRFLCWVCSIFYWNSRKIKFQIAGAVNEALAKHFSDEGISVIAEPGTFFVKSAFTLVVNIIARRIKTTDAGEFYLKISMFIISRISFFGYIDDFRWWNISLFVPFTQNLDLFHRGRGDRFLLRQWRSVWFVWHTGKETTRRRSCCQRTYFYRISTFRYILGVRLNKDLRLFNVTCASHIGTRKR